MKAKVIINEQHSLMKEQEDLLNRKFGEDGWEFLSVPSTGWTIEEQRKIAWELEGGIFKKSTVVFASPVPFLLARMGTVVGQEESTGVICTEIFLFHNDRREKKELPNGKVISVVAQTGWQLIEI